MVESGPRRNVRGVVQNLVAFFRAYHPAHDDEDLEKNQICCSQCKHVRHRSQHVRTWNSDSLGKFLMENNFNVESIHALNMLENIKTVTMTRLLINVLKRIYKNLFLSKPEHLVAVATKNR